MKNKRIKISIVSSLFVIFAFVMCFVLNYNINQDDSFIVNNTNITGKQHDDSIEFLFMEKGEVNIGESEKIYASFYEPKYAENSYLVYHKEDCETKYQQPTFVNDEVVLYELTFENKEDIGKYTFDKICWTVDDNGYQNIDKSNKGYSFSVVAPIESFDEDELPGDINKYDCGVGSSSDAMYISKEASQLNSSNGLTICLDPGHGGGEGGSSYGGLVEKNLNLRIAQACKEQLQSYPGVNVVMTRDGDWDVGLQDRAVIANNYCANLFVSMHNNAGGGTGAEVWVQYGGCTWLNQFNAIGEDIANKILDKLCNKMGLNNRGIKSNTWDERRYPDGSVGDYFAVLYWSRYYGIPGILVEHAFIDSDWGFLANDANLVQMGKYDAEAIAEYYGLSMYGPSDILSGTYRINTSINNQKVVDVVDKSKADEARLNIMNDDSSSSQRWKVETDDNSWVAIQNINSGKYLDVYQNQVFDKQIVQLYEKTGGDNQKWKIIKVGDNYKLISKLNPLYVLDIPGGSLDSSNYLEMYKDNGGNNQLFGFTIDIPASDSDIEDGYYSFSSIGNDKQVIKIKDSSLVKGAKVETNQRNDNYPDQIFKVEKDKKTGKYHKITNIVTDQCLDVEGWKTSIGDYLEQWESNGGLNQLWSIQKQKDNSYCFYSACNGQVIDCYQGVIQSSNPICLYNYNNGVNQKWKMNKVDDPFKKLDDLASAHRDDVKDGIYEVASSENSRFVLDVYGASADNSANIQLYHSNEGANQQWEVIHDENGYVSFINVNSKKYLDIYGAIKCRNTNVVQYESTKASNQKWIVIKVDNSQYKIMSASIYNDLLTCSSLKPIDETNVIADYEKNSSSQLFNLNKLNVDVDPSDPSFNEGYYKIYNDADDDLCADLEGSSTDDGAKILLWDENSVSMNQEFQFIKCGNYHKIKSIISDKFLTYSSDKSVVQEPISDDLGQSWSVQIKNDKYYLVNAKNGLLLDVNKQRAVEGAYLKINTDSDASTQKWILTPQVDPFTSVAQLAKDNAGTLVDGLYSISLTASNSFAIDVYGGTMVPGENVQLYQYHSDANQKWFVENDMTTGYVMFRNENSGQYLDVSCGSKKIHSNVTQYIKNDGLNQKWIIIKDGDSYRIHSAELLNLYMCSQDFPVGNCSNICASFGVKDEQQKFNFTQAEPTPPPATGTLIIHPSRTNCEKLVRYYISSGHIYPDFYKDKQYSSLDSFCQACCDISVLEGVDPSVVFCLMMKETGWLHYGGQVEISQYNFGGIKNADGIGFHSFNNMYEGILAVVQHLKAYACTYPLNTPKVDPRFDLVNRGVAPCVEDLGGPGKWTPEPSYGYDIRNMMSVLWSK